MLSGQIEATTSDGASRVFGPGDAVLVLTKRRHPDGQPWHWHPAQGVAIASIAPKEATVGPAPGAVAHSEELIREIRVLGADPDLAEVIAAVARGVAVVPAPGN